MPDETQNHGLLIYSIGEQDWTHTPDIETIEERLPIAFDIEQNLDQYDPHDGAMFIDSETGKVFEGDGTEWTQPERDFLRIFEDGSRVATRAYVDNELDGFTGGSGAPEIHNNDHHDPNYATATDLADHDASSTGVHGTGDSGVASGNDVDDAISNHAQQTNVHGLPGGTLADESYVDTTVDDEIGLHAGITDAHHAPPTDADIKTVIDGSDVAVAQATDATFWDGYELVVGSETADTNKYIRFEEST